MMQRFVQMFCQAWKDHCMKLFLIAFILVIFFSCSKEQTETETISVALNNCSEQPLDVQSYLLCFDSLVEDSRCPDNAVCIWQGVAKAKFRFNVNSQEHVVTLSTLNMAPNYTRDTTVAGYHLKLVNILPYPLNPNNPNPQGEVKATVEITQ
jgi:hypothetical protein